MRHRGVRGDGHMLLTPANRYASRLPWLPHALAYKLVSPRLAPAEFAQQLLCLDTGPPAPVTLPSTWEQFLYVLGGGLRLRAQDGEHELGAGSFAYAGPGSELTLVDATAAEALRIHRPWTPLPGRRPPRLALGHRERAPAQPTGVSGLTRRELLPGDDPAFDFTISVMAFAPGARLDQVEIHDEEHGLYMLAGSGIYLLGDAWHEVEADDFIYLAPYCPQTFVAGADGAEYLLYKDAFRELP